VTSTPPAESVLPLAAADLACYAQLVYPGFEIPWHLELLVDHLEAVERGEIKRLMIFKPPRHGGSLTSVRLFPSWYLGRNPAAASSLPPTAKTWATTMGARCATSSLIRYTLRSFPLASCHLIRAPSTASPPPGAEALFSLVAWARLQVVGLR